MAPIIPHFDIPFRYVGLKPATVQQDTLDDISNCVEAILRTRQGERLEIPTFGSDDLTFSPQPVRLQTLIEEILEQEPRATILMDQNPSAFDSLIANITVRVSQNQGG